MATGDRFGLADKQTLDIVKQTADSIKLDTYNLNQTAEAIKDNMNNSPTNREYITANDIVGLKYKAGTVPVNTTSSSTVLHTVSGSGFLYSMIYVSSNYINTSAGGTDTIILDVDGINNVYVSSNTHITSDSYGIITPDTLITATSSILIPVPADNPVTFVNKPLAVNPRSAGSSFLFLPKPLRFEQSLTIRGSVSTTTSITNYGKLFYLYILD